MKNILIAIDYAPSAQKVAEQGYMLGKALNAKVTLLHVIEEVMYYASSSYNPIMGFGGYVNTNFLDTDIINSVKQESNQYLEKIKKHLHDENIAIEVIEGGIADTVMKVAKKIQADVIVVGTHSRNMLQEIVLGSTANKLLKHSKIPLFIIPN